MPGARSPTTSRAPPTGKDKIAGSTLKLDRFANGADATFTMQGDGTLAGTYALSGATYTGVFSRR